MKDCQDWFRDQLPVIVGGRQSWVGTWSAPTPQECSKLLEDAVKELIESAGLGREERLSINPTGHHCRIFILTMRASNMRMPVRLRSYQSRMDSATKECTIWEAARATTASLSEFLPIKIGPMDVSYVSAGLGFSNPAKEAFDEAVRIWHLSDIGCLVSIGTGITPPARLETGLDSTSVLTMLNLSNLSRLPELLHTFFRAAIDCERTHEELSQDACSLGLNYFRFNVETGLENIARYDVSGKEILRTATDDYLQRSETANLLSLCALHVTAGYVSYSRDQGRGLQSQASR